MNASRGIEGIHRTPCFTESAPVLTMSFPDGSATSFFRRGMGGVEFWAGLTGAGSGSLLGLAGRGRFRVPRMSAKGLAAVP